MKKTKVILGSLKVGTIFRFPNGRVQCYVTAKDSDSLRYQAGRSNFVSWADSEEYLSEVIVIAERS